MGRFDGKKVVVTGGTGALGKAVVELIVREGGEVWVPVHGKAGASGKGVTFVEGIDLTDEGAVAGFYEKVGALWGSVHTAGGFAMGKVAETSKGDFVAMMEQNAVTAFLCCREAVKGIRKGGAGGRIVNVGAKPAVTAVGGMVAYSASKAAVVSITESLGEELAPEGIWVNAVLPSVMDTPANRKAFPAGTDFSKWPTVEAVAATIGFLVSGENAVTRGAAVAVYGGI